MRKEERSNKVFLTKPIDFSREVLVFVAIKENNGLIVNCRGLFTFSVLLNNFLFFNCFPFC